MQADAAETGDKRRGDGMTCPFNGARVKMSVGGLRPPRLGKLKDKNAVCEWASCQIKGDWR